MHKPLAAPPSETVQAQVAKTRRAARALARLSGDDRNRLLLAAADEIEARSADILAANQRDCDALAPQVASGKVAQAMAKRLKTSAAGVREMAAHVRDVAKLAPPLAQVFSTTELDDGLILEKVSCPLGVIAVIFESRPDVVPQVGSLAIKTGNGLVLKGGTEARQTNRVLHAIWREVLARHAAALADAICLLEERAEIMQVLGMERDIDLVVPRGSTEFVNFVFQNSCIPVLGHGSGICHIYVDASADLEKSKPIIVDAKAQYPAACNSVEKVLIHEAVADRFLPELAAALQQAGVEIRGCERSRRIVPGISAATEEDWQTEYCDLKLTVRVVRDLDEAIDHIERYGSRHTESILTEDTSAAERFLDEVDAASVFHNASTRFADGYRYGFGAEVGISTSKLHARGPVGMEGLISYKYKLRGSGQTVSPYAEGKRTFKHKKR